MANFFVADKQRVILSTLSLFSSTTRSSASFRVFLSNPLEKIFSHFTWTKSIGNLHMLFWFDAQWQKALTVLVHVVRMLECEASTMAFFIPASKTNRPSEGSIRSVILQFTDLVSRKLLKLLPTSIFLHADLICELFPSSVLLEPYTERTRLSLIDTNLPILS